jgi:hypothetical protein
MVLVNHVINREVKMIRLFLVLLVAALVGGCTSPTYTSGRVGYYDRHASVDIIFDGHDRRLIRNYFYKHRKRLPPGLAKRDRLPPGLAKRDRLPPGLGGHPLPHDLERQLRRLPDGYVRLRMGKDIVLMDSRSRVVFDIIFDID